MTDWIISLGVEEPYASKAVVKLCADGYTTLADLYRLAGSKQNNMMGGLMKYFTKLGHVDKVDPTYYPASPGLSRPSGRPERDGTFAPTPCRPRRSVPGLPTASSSCA